MKKNNPYFNSNLSFIDLLFLLVVHIFALFILAIIMINPPAAKKVDEKAELLITMTWPDDNADDVDLWVLLPNNEKVGYAKKEASYATL